MTRRAPLLAAAALASLALAACGGDDGAGGPDGRPPAQVVAAGDPAQGREVFGQNCAACHGGEGEGGTGPKLAGSAEATNAEAVVDQVRNGGGGMPSFGERLSAQELSDVSAYVVEQLAAP